MTRKKLNRGALAGANRSSGFVQANERPEITPSVTARQADFIARRFGVSLALASAVASLAFSDQGRRT